MLHDIIFLVLGLALIVVGGNAVTDGAVTVARKFNVSNLVIGLTVVAFGSSAPDLVVCLTSTLEGKSQMALGDVIGANTFDILLCVGVVALVRPISLTTDMVNKDLPMLVLSALVIFFCGDDILFDGARADIISRTDGLMMLGFFAIFMAYTLQNAKTARLARMVAGKPQASQTPVAPAVSAPQMWKAAAYIVAGLAALIVGGNWIVDGASGIALKAGLSESLVGLTIVAIGSSLPDMATSIAAAVKNHPGIAIGNIVGASIFNIFFILGFCSTLKPLNSGNITLVDFSTLAGGAIVLWLFGCVIGRGKISRIEGAVLALGYAAYMTYLVLNA